FELRISFWHIRKRHIRCHPGAEFAFAIVQSNFDAENLFDAFTNGLDIARCELSVPRDLLNSPMKIFAGVGIDSYCDRLTQLNVAKPRFRNEHAHPKMLCEQER